MTYKINKKKDKIQSNQRSCKKTINKNEYFKCNYINYVEYT